MTILRLFLSEALELMTTQGYTPMAAEEELLGKLRSGAIQAIAAKTSTEFNGSDRSAVKTGVFLDKCYWNFAKIDWSEPGRVVTYDYFEEDEHGCYWGFRVECDGVTVFRSQIEELALPPDLQRIARSPTMDGDCLVPKHKGGAPGKYDWEALLTFAAVSIVEDGLPPRESGELQQRFSDWFAARDLYPSSSEVRKRVRLIYEAFGKVALTTC